MTNCITSRLIWVYIVCIGIVFWSFGLKGLRFLLFSWQTPPGTICPGRKQTKPVPQLAGKYSYREEIVSLGSQQISQADVSTLFELGPRKSGEIPCLTLTAHLSISADSGNYNYRKHHCNFIQLSIKAYVICSF